MTPPKFEPTRAHRVQWSLATLLALLFAIGSVFLVLLTHTSMQMPGGAGDGALAVCLLAFFVSVFATGASLGMAAVPKGVAGRGRAGSFSWAMGLVVTGLLFVFPTPLILFTAPIAVLMWVGAGALWVRARR